MYVTKTPSSLPLTPVNVLAARIISMIARSKSWLGDIERSVGTSLDIDRGIDGRLYVLVFIPLLAVPQFGGILHVFRGFRNRYLTPPAITRRLCVRNTGGESIQLSDCTGHGCSRFPPSWDFQSKQLYVHVAVTGVRSLEGAFGSKILRNIPKDST